MQNELDKVNLLRQINKEENVIYVHSALTCIGYGSSSAGLMQSQLPLRIYVCSRDDD